MLTAVSKASDGAQVASAMGLRRVRAEFEDEIDDFARDDAPLLAKSSRVPAATREALSSHLAMRKACIDWTSKTLADFGKMVFPPKAKEQVVARIAEAEGVAKADAAALKLAEAGPALRAPTPKSTSSIKPSKPADDEDDEDEDDAPSGPRR